MSSTISPGISKIMPKSLCPTSAMPCPFRHPQASACLLRYVDDFSEKDIMDIQSIVTQLKQEASRIEQAIAALVGLSSQPPRRGRPPKVTARVEAGGRK